MASDSANNARFVDLSLFPATREQVIQSRKQTATEWASGRTLEEYLHRDEVLDAYEHAADGKLVTWVLAPRNNPTTLDFLCSCETYRRAALIAKQSTDATRSEILEVIGYGVASVFTPHWNRKKGYAHHMTRLLHWVLAPRSALPATFPPEWGAPPSSEMLQSLNVANAQFSVLYSDVGREFYLSCGTDTTSRNGWSVMGATETFWTRDLGPPASRPDPPPPTAKTQRLTKEEVISLYDRDALWIRDDLLHTITPGSTRFTFLPDKGVGGWAIDRLVTFTHDLQPFMPLSHWGAAILPTSSATLSDGLGQSGAVPFISWTLNSITDSPHVLVVTRLRADESTFPVLLNELLEFAQEVDAEKVEFWYLTPELRAIAEAGGWRTAERTEHISAVKWYGDENGDQLEWVYNEKFCWC